MSKPSYTSDLLRGWKAIAGFAAIGLLLAVGLSFTQPLRYSSTIEMLILQDAGTTDAYTAGQSEERIADDLATIIRTTTFFDDVLSSGFNIDQSSFPTDDLARRKAWMESVDTSVEPGTGFLTITTYHQNVAQAEQLARAIAFVLTKDVGSYTAESNVQVLLIDAPLDSKYPVKPNFLLNGASGLALGVLVGMAFVLIAAERTRRRHQLVHEEFI